MKIGTPLADVTAFCCGKTEEETLREYEVRMGGPMMGSLQECPGTAVIRGTTGFTFLPRPVVRSSRENECIRCGRCVDVCPMELHPLMYVRYGKQEMWEETRRYRAADCIECGCCQYVCSSKIDILSYIREAKKHAGDPVQKS